MNPSTIGGYEILGELGRGAMGVVYHGRDAAIGRPVAIKVIRVDWSTSAREGAELRQRLIREASVAGKIYHPGIVTVHQLGEEGNNVFIVMEYVEGASLENLLINKPKADQAWTLDILAQVAVALDCAHKMGVVHRDVKPANILVRSDGRVKIADFGIAKITASATTGMTGAGMSIGSPAYMSPEQIQAAEIDGRSDQFALGVIAFQMLAGRMPFKGTTAHTLMFQIVMGDPFEPQAGDVPISAEVRAVLAKALAKHARDRFPDCASFIQALTAAATAPSTVIPAGPVTATRFTAPAAAAAKLTPSAHTAVKQKPKRSVLLPITLGVLALVILGGGFWYITRTCCAPPPVPHPEPQKPVSPPVAEAPKEPAPVVKSAPKLAPAKSASKDAKPVATAPRGPMTLFTAVTQGKVDAMKSLLANGANINEAQTDGTTPLMLASEKAAAPMVQALIDGRAALEARDSLGRTALDRASAAGQTEVAALLLGSGALVNTRAHDGTSPLLYAVEAGKLPVVQLLIARHAQVDLADSSGTTPLMAASEGNANVPVSKPFVDALLAGGAKVDAVDARRRSALYRAAAAGRPEAARILLENHAKPNLRALDKSTPLIAAITYNRPVAVEVLLNHGADANLADGSGSTPLMIAADASPAIGDPGKLIKMLLDHGAKKALKDTKGRTALQRATESHNAGAVSALR